MTEPLATHLAGSIRSLEGRGRTSVVSLLERDLLLRELRVIDPEKLAENDKFLVIINVADTKSYDEFIHIFGHRFVQDLFNVRIAALDFILLESPLYEVGFWCIGFIYQFDSRGMIHVSRDDRLKSFERLADRIATALSEPIICRGIPIPIKAGIGVCDLSKITGSVEDVVQAAFMAGQISSDSPDRWAFCDYEVFDAQARAFTIISDFEFSITQTQEFALCFQPRMNLKHMKYLSAEALLRWSHPRLGVIPPKEFIPLVERTGLIRELTNWVITQAVAEAAEWHRKGNLLQVSVNVSSKNLVEDDFVESVAEILQRYSLGAQYLEIEISEGQLISNMELAMQHLRELRELGVGVAIDDFGTGPNSFVYLETTPGNVIKIDHTLISSLKDNARNHAVVRSIISMVHEVGLAIVAKGVETRKELELLASWRCDAVQGYYLARPMFRDEFEKWFAELPLALKSPEFVTLN